MEHEENNQSEVARLTRQITDEYEAGQRGLQGLSSGTSQHGFITARMENMERARQELEKLVGPDAATRLVVEAMCSPVEQSAPLSLPSSWKLSRATRAWLQGT